MDDIKKILAAVSDDIGAIEKALADNLNPYFDLVQQVAGHILFAGGKRLRPLLTVLCARLCGSSDNNIARYATIFEYLHAATLLHDDLVDGADMRRGRQVANLTWDNPTAVLTGDFLLARGLSIAAETGLCEVIEVIAGITENMSQGEIRQLQKKGDVSLTEDQYLEVIRCKTAVLFQGACRTGALVSHANEGQVQALSDYGYHLGVAFQMADDLFDYTLTTTDFGKAVGADLREGKLTLPVISALRNASSDDKELMIKIIKDPNFSVEDFETLIELLDKHGGLAYTQKLAAAYIDKAKRALSTFESSPTRDIMLDIADYALARRL